MSALVKPQTAQGDLYTDLEALPPNMVGQIVGGSLHAHPRPSHEHGVAATELTLELGSPFRRGRGGPGGWRFIVEQELRLGADVLVPDISGWREERYPAQAKTPYFAVAPDWLCEFLSPSTERLDRFQKLPVYARKAVHHCWYVDPIKKTLEVFILSGANYIVGPTFADNDPVTAPPFEAHTFNLSVLWETP